ncbi:hypothetical protein C2E20_3215 [Micractinium conductrix]|uniref:Uncharacterized protein n=1 Tax=Micractinium conductrix TaxID=554055 RepID=A0A2P6VHJ5_9CHLO|nr:hypothetical protein C2E20_3215 [Micractinium conductrix]|eukprot:PSC73555.1 hypothetical protein C2E20_3215 [Micractinium conductrix]
MAAVRLSAARLVLAGLQRQQRTVAAPPLRRPERRLLPPLTSSSSSAAVPSPDSSSSNGASTPASASSNGAGTAPGGAAPAAEASSGAGGLFGWLRAQRERSAALRVKLASLGLAAVLAYGLFDGLTYTVAFSLAFLGYEARYGVNPTTDMAAVAKICVLMWAGNNVTRPFRLAGAAALAPFMDKLMDKLQARLKLKSKGAAFALLVAAVASVCFSALGALFFSRWVQG